MDITRSSRYDFHQLIEAKYDLSTAVGDLEFLIQAQKKLAQAGAKLKVHLALDTGNCDIMFDRS